MFIPVLCSEGWAVVEFGLGGERMLRGTVGVGEDCLPCICTCYCWACAWVAPGLVIGYGIEVEAREGGPLERSDAYAGF